MQALYDALEQGGVGLFESPTGEGKEEGGRKCGKIGGTSLFLDPAPTSPSPSSSSFVLRQQTGTGKTLSLLVAALTWLEDKRAAEAVAEVEMAGGAETGAAPAAAPLSDLPPWLADAAAAAVVASRSTYAARRAVRLAKARARVAAREAAERAAEAGSRAAWASLGRAAPPAMRRAPGAGDDDGDGDDALDADFIISDDDEEEDRARGKRGRGHGRRGASPPPPEEGEDGATSEEESGPLGEEEGADAARGPGGAPLPPNRVRAASTQVIITSRTHSQLAQFVGELNRTRFGGGGGGGGGGGDGGEAGGGEGKKGGGCCAAPPPSSPRLSATAVALGSRAALCINDAVRGLGSAARIAERCRDLATKKQAAPKTSTDDGNGKKSKAATRGGGGCPFRNPPPSARRALADTIIAHPTDVEALATAGRKHGACPYYGARAVAERADIVFLPYAALLSPDARQALGVRLRGAVVIVDEAHNLPGAVAGAAGAGVSEAGLGTASAALSSYLARYGARLGPGTRKEVQTLLAMADGLGRLLRSGGGGEGGEGAPNSAAPPAAAAAGAAEPPAPAVLLTVDAASSAAGIDNVNAFRLVASLRERKVVPKVAGAADAAAARAAREAGGGAVVPSARRRGARGGRPPLPPPAAADALDAGDDEAAPNPSPTAALHALVSFVAALTTADADGRVIVEEGRGSSSSPKTGASPTTTTTRSLRFILLNAGARFAGVLAEARAVVLASGTLEPSASLEAQLFPGGLGGGARAGRAGGGGGGARAGGAAAPRPAAPPLPPPPPTTRFSCGHVLPPHRLLALGVGAGPTGLALDLRHGSRATHPTLDEMGRLLLNVCAAVPAGVVAFFPSFAHMGAAVDRWAATGLLAALARKKGGGGAVTVEPRGAAAAAAALAAYAAAAASPGGALLLGVIGGKLSEGINFGDALGRGVVVFGLPFPNRADPELAARMAWLEGAGGRGAGRALYTDSAAIAVNQTVGRVVRHAGDWACVVLADARWAVAGPGGAAARLPAWMRPSTRLCGAGGYGEAHGALARFCKARVREDEGGGGGGGGERKV